MSRTQFTFYESFYNALIRIRKGADRAKAYDVIAEYALFGKEPNLDSLPDSVAIAFAVAKPVLDTARRKSSAGKEGASKREANRKQAEAERKQVQVQEQVQDKEQDKDKEQYVTLSSLPAVEKKEERPGRFSPPSVEEVGAYVREKGYHIDPEAFVAFYESKGWKVGSNPMKDWKSAVVTWEKREKEKGGRANGIFGGYHGEDIPELQADVRA